jgi:hypothetical protein
MIDGRKNNRGTIGNKGGRASKADEVALIERLSPMDNDALEALRKGVISGDYNFIKLFFEYRWSKPTQGIKVDGQLDFIWNEVKTYDSNEKTD